MRSDGRCAIAKTDVQMCLMQYALGMLEAVETVHKAGWVGITLNMQKMSEQLTVATPANVTACFIVIYGHDIPVMLQVHLDIKPGNFCTSYYPNDPAEVYIIDFGTAERTHVAGQTDSSYVFFGTVDYSSSRALLQHTRPGPADDIESLCYRCASFQRLPFWTTCHSVFGDASCIWCLINNRVALKMQADLQLPANVERRAALELCSCLQYGR